MTECQWRASSDQNDMLWFLWNAGPVSSRKLRMFAVACCRRVWPLLPESSRRAAEAAERFADGRASPDDLMVEGRKAELAFRDAFDAAGFPRGGASPSADALHEVRLDASAAASAGEWVASFFEEFPSATADSCADAVAHAAAPLTAERAQLPESLARVTARRSEREAQSSLLRCIFGNPFYLDSFSPSWRTEAVLALARGIYEEREFDRMPALAEALEVAGCDIAEVLEHCRGPNVHVRGCWVVDAVLGRS